MVAQQWEFDEKSQIRVLCIGISTTFSLVLEDKKLSIFVVLLCSLNSEKLMKNRKNSFLHKHIDYLETYFGGTRFLVILDHFDNLNEIHWHKIFVHFSRFQQHIYFGQIPHKQLAGWIHSFVSFQTNLVGFQNTQDSSVENELFHDK